MTKRKNWLFWFWIWATVAGSVYLAFCDSSNWSPLANWLMLAVILAYGIAVGFAVFLTFLSALGWIAGFLAERQIYGRAKARLAQLDLEESLDDYEQAVLFVESEVEEIFPMGLQEEVVDRILRRLMD